MLSCTLRSAIRLNAWKMKPIFSLRSRERWLSLRPRTLAPSSWYSPPREFLEQARDGQKGGLARARGPGDRDELAFAHMDREIAQRVGLDDFGAIGLGQVGHFEHGGASCGRCGCND